MAIKKHPQEAEIDFGERLESLRLTQGFNSIDSFARAFNDGKPHKDFSAYIKGKNVRFHTILKFAWTLRVDLPTLLDFKGIHTIGEFNFNQTLEDAIEYWLGIFCENIVRYRKEKFGTQLEYEQTVGMDRENITNYETGRIKPSLVTIARFADAFGLELRDLFIPKP